MIRKLMILLFFLATVVIFSGLFGLALTIANWPGIVAWSLAIILAIVLSESANDYWKRIFQESCRIKSKRPPTGRWACKRIVAVFAAAMIASWLGYGFTAACLSPRNPLIRPFSEQKTTHRDRVLDRQNTPPSLSATAIPPECPGLLGFMRYVAGLLAGVSAWKYVADRLIPPHPTPSKEPYYRGRRLLSLAEARRQAEMSTPEGDEGVPLGGIQIPTESTKTHTVMLGASGSGKTLSIRIQLQHALARIGFGQDRRALIYDGKRELLSYLFNMRLRCPIRILNPFDVRGVAWDIAKDCTDPATACEIASILLPSQGESQAYFVNAAQDILSGVLMAYHLHCPGKWTFRDVIIALETPDALRHLLNLHFETRNRLNYFAKDATFLDILTTISTRIAAYRQIAAAWNYATERISLQDWANGAFVLVLSTDESMRRSLDAINQTMFKRATELVLAQNESPDRETWIVLDELREAGKLDGLTSLLTKGRSFGTRVIVGFQDIEGLRAVYGDKEANEIAGLCSNKATFRLDDAETALWASKLFGDYEYYEKQQSTTSNTSSGQTTTSQTTTQQLKKRQVVMPEQILGLPPTNRHNGLSGYYISPIVGCFHSTLTAEYLEENLLPANPNEPNFIPRSKDQLYLKPWNEFDLQRLNLDDYKGKSSPEPITSNHTPNTPPAETTAISPLPLPDSMAADTTPPSGDNPPPIDLKTLHRVERPRNQQEP